MSSIDTAALLQEISPEAPSGENLEYDPLFLEMERAAEGKPEQQMGDETIAAEEPNWKEVKAKGLELAARTKDLRVAVNLLKAVARADGFEGLRDGLGLVHGYIQQDWETVHPQLDPEDGNDPTMRVNVLTSLTDPDAVLGAVRETPLVRSPVAGTFSFRDLLLARGEIPAPEGAEVPAEALINGAFSECDLQELQATAEACKSAREVAAAIEDTLTEKVGAANAADLSALPALLGEVHEVLAVQLAARGVAVESLEGEAAAEGQAQAISGEVRSREDVVRMLEKISRYYEAHEPSSPIPLLMERARSLVHANFMELIEDLAPGGLNEIKNIRGKQE